MDNLSSTISRVCFITPEYPVSGDMTNVFVDALICEMARQGIHCTVIAPFDVFRYLRKKGKKRSRHWIRTVNNKISFDVYAPPFFGFTGHKGVANVSQTLYNKTVLNEFDRINKELRFDAVYGHFFGPGGIPAQLIGDKYGIPSFVACGESSLTKLYGNESQERYARCLKGITGIISVSTKNRDEIISTWGSYLDDVSLITSKIEVFPNGYSSEDFYVMDKESIRNALGIPQNDFVISFSGRFKEHKGINELNQALQNLDTVGAIFIGDGDVKPKCRNMLFSGKVDHHLVAQYLNASDVFVLPTKAEGCSNAIVEALACGLPVISSNLPFNYDVLNDKNSILVDPDNPNEIEAAIREIRDNETKYAELRQGAIETSKMLTISNRAKNIIRFMEKLSTRSI